VYTEKMIYDKTFAKLMHALFDISPARGEGYSVAEVKGRAMEKADQDVREAAQAEKLAWLDRALFG